MNFILNTLILILKVSSCMLYLNFVSKYFLHKKYSPFNTVLTVIPLIFIMIMYNATNKTSGKEIFLFTTLFILLVIIKQFKPIKAVIFTIVYCMISYSFTLFSIYVSLFFNNLSIYHYNVNRSLTNINILCIESVLLCLIALLNVFILKHKSIKEFLGILDLKHLFVLIMIISVSIVPHMLLTSFSNLDFRPEYYVIAALQLLLSCLFSAIYIFCYIRADYLEKSNTLLSTDVKAMSGVIDETRAMKHDFNNIFQALHGLSVSKKYDELDKYITKLMVNCQDINTLSIINENTFNDPGIYALVGSKIFLANSNNIHFKVDSTLDFKNISFDKIDFIRILGILLDNAIEANMNSKDKYIHLSCTHDNKKSASIITVSNTFDSNKKIDTNKIFKKGFSTKKIKSGIGLWETSKLINKHSNSQLLTNIKDNIFTQTLVIEDSAQDECLESSSIANTESELNFEINT